MELENIKNYWNKRAEGYSLSINEQLQNDVKEECLSMLQKYAPNKPNLDCLDIGCGPGFLSILLAQWGHKVTAVDYSENMLEYASKNFSEAKVDVSLLQMDAQNLQFEDASFDYIVSRDLVWNLENPDKAYTEWMRVLRPGGHILILDGNYYLHYYSKDYEEAIKSKENKPTHKYMLGVDSTPIENIAKELPLSRQYRPAWDISYFINAGASNISSDIKRERYINSQSNTEKSVISKFALCVVKAE
ncbi:methylase involved in ubiquinone/menaquinone biosynthesis [Clostridium aceticum]|uniref:Methylase involved in ubiquinone/menaquinone biosynthesis n=1 Tax=Clostridium aceticum TaxID=84022 RepID=A0A0D8IAH6_9CLOT|nr:class I SAM-dependent methyltransferase [Clostridium aceticum]AKL96565.1 methylase involved in ubiquinone/menaquinone biosynthesis [Clostridium aceticum]KJF27278.1 hypothetical protein TZ02_07990 [Clostridium aceticum]